MKQTGEKSKLLRIGTAYLDLIPPCLTKEYSDEREFIESAIAEKTSKIKSKTMEVKI